jgi:hypothetical protein
VAVTLPTISPGAKHPAGGCCTPAVHAHLGEAAAADVARVAKALGDPIRLRIVDAVRKAGVLAVQRHGLWAYLLRPRGLHAGGAPRMAGPTADTDIRRGGPGALRGRRPRGATGRRGRVLRRRLRERSGGAEAFGAGLYGAEAAGAPPAAVGASLGCGVATAVADLRAGETVLDLGSGAGADVLISARRVGRRDG